MTLSEAAEKCRKVRDSIQYGSIVYSDPNVLRKVLAEGLKTAQELLEGLEAEKPAAVVKLRTDEERSLWETTFYKLSGSHPLQAAIAGADTAVLAWQERVRGPDIFPDEEGEAE